MTIEQMEGVAIQLLSCRTIEEVVKTTSIARSTIERLRKSEKFIVVYERIRQQMFSSAISKMQAMTDHAVDVLAGIMDDPHSPANAKVSACRTVLEFGLEAHDRETIIADIEEIKEMLQDEQNKIEPR